MRERGEGGRYPIHPNCGAGRGSPKADLTTNASFSFFLQFSPMSSKRCSSLSLQLNTEEEGQEIQVELKIAMAMLMTCILIRDMHGFLQFR